MSAYFYRITERHIKGDSNPLAPVKETICNTLGEKNILYRHVYIYIYIFVCVCVCVCGVCVCVCGVCVCVCSNSTMRFGRRKTLGFLLVCLWGGKNIRIVSCAEIYSTNSIDHLYSPVQWNVIMVAKSLLHNRPKHNRWTLQNSGSSGISCWYSKVRTAVAQWLRCCATNRKVAGSIPAGVIGIFHWYKILPIALWPWGRLSL